MIGYNEKKTKELIEEIKATGQITGAADLSSFMRKSGVLVKESIGRKRSHIEVSPKMYGVNLSEKGQTTQVFFKEYMRQGRMTYIPESYDRLLTNAENAIRIARRRACIGYDEKFMTMETFRDFSKKFEQARTDYLKLRDQIVQEWDILIARFKSHLNDSLRDLNSLDREIIETSVLSRVPTKEEYGNSFYMQLKVDPFPVMENLDMFEPEIRSQIEANSQDDAISTMYQVLGNALNDAFDQTSRFLKSMDQSEKISTRSIDAMKSAAKRIRQKNILGNAQLTKVADDLEELGRKHSVDEKAELCEVLLAEIYAYAVELEIENTISFTNCTLTSKELIELNKFIATEAS